MNFGDVVTNHSGLETVVDATHVFARRVGAAVHETYDAAKEYVQDAGIKLYVAGQNARALIDEHPNAKKALAIGSAFVGIAAIAALAMTPETASATNSLGNAADNLAVPFHGTWNGLGTGLCQYRLGTKWWSFVPPVCNRTYDGAVLRSIIEWSHY